MRVTRRSSKKVGLFQCKRPCRSCPYRKDAPVKLWAEEEFDGVLANEADVLGKVYRCHRNHGGVCVGFLMDQERRDFPSIALRISLSQHDVTREYLDSLSSPAPLYASVRGMVRANYPRLLRKYPRQPVERGLGKWPRRSRKK